MASDPPPAPPAQASSSPHAVPPDALLPAETQPQLAARCGSMMQGAISCLAVYIGHELGLYKLLRDRGVCTPEQLAQAAGLSERWMREWLYQQSAARLVCCDKEAARFWMSAAQAATLVEADSLDQAQESPLEMMLKMPVVLGKHEALLGAFRSGLGLTFDGMGIDHCHMHRHARAVQLVERMKLLPGLLERLAAGVKVADVGCGSGEVLLHLAALFPNSTFWGYDISTRALSAANQHKQRRGLSNVTFLNPADGPDSRLPSQPTFHVVVVLDAIHDMTQPQEMLQAIRQSLLEDEGAAGSGGGSSAQPPAEQQQQQQQQQQQDALAGYAGGPVFLVTDIKSCPEGPAANIATLPHAPFLYGVSLGICMSSALSEAGGAGLGTVGWNEDVARRMSAAAGFSRFTKLDWDPENGMGWHAHYMLRP